MDAENDFHVKDGWLHFDNQKIPSFTGVRATLSGDPGYFVAMTDEGHPIFAWPDYNRSTCDCQHTNIETYLPGKIPPIELATTPIKKVDAKEEGNVVALRPQRIVTDQGFGGCPECGETNGYLNVGRDHWFFCDTHKTRWRAGSNLFSACSEETEAEWQLNENRLAAYSIVKPIHTKPTEEERRLGIVASGDLDRSIPF